MTVAIVSATLDKTVYNKGDLVTATIVYTDSSTTTTELHDVNTVTETDTASGETTTATFDIVVNETVTVEGVSTVNVVSSTGRTWTTVSNVAGTAVLTTVA